MLSYDQGRGTNAGFIVAESAFDARYQGKCESIFCLGNGYLGLRSAVDEPIWGRTPGLFVQGVFDKAGKDEVTELANLPDPTQIRLTVDGHPFSMASGRASKHERVLNMRTADTRRTLSWKAPSGARTRLCFERFASLADVHLVAQRVTFRALSSCTLAVDSGIDGRVTNTGSQHFLEGEKRIYDGRILEMCSTTAESQVTCCLHVTHRFFLDGQEVVPALAPIIDRRWLSVCASFCLQKGQTLVVEKLTSVHTSRDLAYAHSTPATQADGLAHIKTVARQGFETLRTTHRRQWTTQWQKMDVQLDSPNVLDQLALRFALYHLNILVQKEDERMGIAAKGLSGEGYKGHSFWDTEIFILPYFTLTQPDVARTLLSYRYRTIEGARQKARDNGFSGAMYPWESAWMDDGEVTPLWGAADVVTGNPMPILTGMIEQHITADIAFAVRQYAIATGDISFMEDAGYEILLDTAQFWSSRATWNAGRDAYEILDVIGPDEYKEHVDNNAYTNYLAHYNMRLGLWAMGAMCAQTRTRLLARFDFAKLKADILRVLSKLVLPKPNADQIIPQFDSYFDMQHVDLAPYKQKSIVGTIQQHYNNEQLRHMQVSKQADLLVLFFLLDDLFPADIKTKNYWFYEARTLHDSSLSRSTHAVLASDLALHETAYDFFVGAAQTDLGRNMTSSDMGIHAASMGGLWQAAVYGFGGVRIVGEHLSIQPQLPSLWKSLSFPLVWQGQPLRVLVTPQGVAIQNQGKQSVTVTLNGTPTPVPAQGSVDANTITSRR